jgi:hypothetical protein
VIAFLFPAITKPGDEPGFNFAVFQDTTPTKNYVAFRDIAYARIGKPSYIQHPSLRRGNCHLGAVGNPWVRPFQ